MLVRIKKPEEFNHLPDNCQFYACRGNGIRLGYLGIHIANGQAGIHFHAIHWSHNALKILLKDWSVTVRSLKSLGVRELIASNVNIEDKRWPRFIKLFGFPEPRLINMSKMEI